MIVESRQIRRENGVGSHGGRKRLEMLKQIAAGIAAQFGRQLRGGDPRCEPAVTRITTIVHIENGHVSGRKVGDGASQVVLEQLASSGTSSPRITCAI